MAACHVCKPPLNFLVQIYDRREFVFKFVCISLCCHPGEHERKDPVLILPIHDLLKGSSFKISTCLSTRTYRDILCNPIFVNVSLQELTRGHVREGLIRTHLCRRVGGGYRRPRFVVGRVPRSSSIEPWRSVAGETCDLAGEGVRLGCLRAVESDRCVALATVST